MLYRRDFSTEQDHDSQSKKARGCSKRTPTPLGFASGKEKQHISGEEDLPIGPWGKINHHRSLQPKPGPPVPVQSSRLYTDMDQSDGAGVPPTCPVPVLYLESTDFAPGTELFGPVSGRDLPMFYEMLQSGPGTKCHTRPRRSALDSAMILPGAGMHSDRNVSPAGRPKRKHQVPAMENGVNIDGILRRVLFFTKRC